MSAKEFNRRYALLIAINQLVVQGYPPQTLVEEACRVVVEQGGFRMAQITLFDPVTTPGRLAARAGVGEGTLHPRIAQASKVFHQRAELVVTHEATSWGAR